MAKKKKEVVEKTTETNEPKGMETKEGDVKKVLEKIKMKPIVEKETITKLDLSKPPKTKEDEQPVDTEKKEDVQEKIIEETTSEEKNTEQSTEEVTEQPVLEEITSEEVKEVQEQPEEVIAETESIEKELPENIQKLVEFMDETGGDLQDYVKLNQDYSDMDNQTLLQEHYKQTKPHLSSDEIDFLMEDQFSYDEEIDDEKDIKRKKLALKEQVANAKTQLEENKSKYYQDIKSGSKLTQEQQKAIDFFDRYNKESEESSKVLKNQQSTFLKKTDNVFSDELKGFEYNVGDKKFRFNVKNTSEVKETQSDIQNLIKKFLNKDNLMEDAKGYHKSIYTAMNADAIANHFYEQGKADATKTSIAESKNVSMDPRQSHSKIEVGGMKFKALGENSNDFKFKIKNKR